MILPEPYPKYLNKDFMEGYRQGYKAAMFEIIEYGQFRYNIEETQVTSTAGTDLKIKEE